MSYEDKLKKAQSKGKMSNLTCAIKKFDQAGDYIVGKLVSIEEFQGEKIQQSCLKYTFETDNGLVSCILGGATDKQLAGRELLNRVLYVEYQGKKDLPDGRSVNQFVVSDITNAG